METSNCVVCGQKSSLHCSACRTVYYCSKLHQKSHWKDHKLTCSGKAYRIEGDVTTGHHLVASKDLKPGTFVLQEQPLILGPKPRNQEDKKVCLGCHKKVTGRGVNCPGCKWPMCGKKVCWEEGRSEHSLGECALLKGARERLPANYQNLWEPKYFYQGITVLRFLSLKEKDPSKWQELMSLKRCASSLKLNALERRTREKIVPIVNQYLLEIAVPEEWIITIITFLATNTLILPELTTQYVYSVGSLFDHSCMANAEHTFAKSGKILVRSTQPIAKGSKITLNYSVNALLGTKKRLESLVMSRFMGECQCQRCCDPTELGTYTSGIFCTQCPNQEGILLPVNPLEKESNWACNKCSAKKSAAFIVNFLESNVAQLVGRDREKMSECAYFLRKYEKILHPNHYLLTDVKMLLCLSSAASFIGKSNMSLTEIAETKKGTIKLLELVDVIAPGSSRLRGKLLFNLASTQTAWANHDVKEGQMTPDEAVFKLEWLLKWSRAAHKILFWSDEETIEEEHALVENAYRACEHIEILIKKVKHFKETGMFDENMN